MDVTILMAVKSNRHNANLKDDLQFVMFASIKGDPTTGCVHEDYTAVSPTHTLKGQGNLLCGNPYSLFGEAVQAFTGEKDNTIHAYHGSAEGLKMWN